MTGPAGLSYGRLITTALLELSHALSVPTRPISARQAVSAAQARHRIYRTTARILHTCMVGLDRAGADRAARLSQAERRASPGCTRSWPPPSPAPVRSSPWSAAQRPMVRSLTG